MANTKKINNNNNNVKKSAPYKCQIEFLSEKVPPGKFVIINYDGHEIVDNAIPGLPGTGTIRYSGVERSFEIRELDIDIECEPHFEIYHCYFGAMHAWMLQDAGKGIPAKCFRGLMLEGMPRAMSGIRVSLHVKNVSKRPRPFRARFVGNPLV